PQAAYYVARNLATMLDGLEPGTLKFSIDRAPPNLEAFPLAAPDGAALAIWLGGRAKDRCDGVPVDVRLEVPCRKAAAHDPLNGVSQELVVAREGNAVLLKGVLVRDWPLVLRFESAPKKP
ncbi:MAG: hypothetical protein NUV77_02265, partial [Thermoguttaceae bacterium]|nr:hypothetical protein [Thermoguttaceae bacterium]